MRPLLKIVAYLAALSGLLALAGPAAASEFEKYALESVSATLTDPNTGLPDNQAGAHADLTVAFRLASKNGEPYAPTRDLAVQLPPGMIGNPQGIPRCTVDQLGNAPEASKCPLASQVGVTEVTVAGNLTGTFVEPIYNMAPPGEGDIVARFGFYAGLYPGLINVRVDPTDYSVVATLEGAPSGAGLVAATSTFWGVPADPVHDEERLLPTEGTHNEKPPPPGRPAGLPPAPFLANPTDCSVQRSLTVTATSYALPGQPSSLSAPFPKITGCGSIAFNPKFALVATNPEASAPTGIDSILEIPQDETAQGRATSTMRRARVSLPVGFTVNPAAGDGLQACSAAEVGFGLNEAAHCPDGAKIGSVEVDVPALERPLHGSVYQRTPEAGHLFRFWLVADEQGVHLKLPAEIEANPLNGQITTAFNGISSLDGIPQVPVSSIKLHVFGGPRAPLATPDSCGTFRTHYVFAPWSGLAPTVGDTPMKITSGCNKGGFAPQLSAGTLIPFGGAFSPLVFTLTRKDGEASPSRIALHLPQGLLAKLAGVPLCPDAAAATGACPAGSRIGSVTAATGVGGAPLWIPQPGKAPTAVYLAGPYKGAPYSVVSVVPAQAGPFDLGLVINRAAIYIDPETALATIETDPLPQFLEGVPASYRAIHVEADRKDFTLNPTSCAKKTISATVTATNGATADPQAGFQATRCARLHYTPKLKLSFHGQTKRTGNPAVRAVLTQKPHQANTAGITVILPPSEFIDQSHINNPCTRVQFNENACPPGSILGTARAVTPILAQPLEGPVYFRSNGGERELPDIVADVSGGGIHIIQVGFIDSVQKKGTEISRVRTRFLRFPDAPVSRIAISFFGGKKGLIENSEDLCRTPHHAQLEFRAQNGRSEVTNPAIVVKCPKRLS